MSSIVENKYENHKNFATTGKLLFYCEFFQLRSNRRRLLYAFIHLRLSAPRTLFDSLNFHPPQSSLFPSSVGFWTPRSLAVSELSNLGNENYAVFESVPKFYFQNSPETIFHFRFIILKLTIYWCFFCSYNFCSGIWFGW